jgi:hypothetical protein
MPRITEVPARPACLDICGIICKLVATCTARTLADNLARDYLSEALERTDRTDERKEEC